MIDTKYKASKQPSPDDVAKVTAYAEMKGCKEAILLYPSQLEKPLDAFIGKIRVRSMTFSLAGDLEEAGQAFLSKLLYLTEGIRPKITINDQITFPIQEINQLRRDAEKAREVPLDGPEGWSKATFDTMKLLAIFTSLRIREDLVLRAYQFRSGGNGNGIVWAMPKNSAFPEPEDCPRLENRFLEPPKPLESMDDLMEAIEGDGSAWSYLCASLFYREAAEYGAIWHGCDWSTYTILYNDPWAVPEVPLVYNKQLEDIFENSDDWKWLGQKPKKWEPSVYRSTNQVTVEFYTYSGLDRQAIYHHMDTYKPDQYQFKSDRKVIAEGPGGYVF